MNKSIYWILTFSIVLNACVNPQEPPEPSPPIETIVDNPERLVFTPSGSLNPEPTLIYFLLDLSAAHPKSEFVGCGELGKHGEEYINFVIANILKPFVLENQQANLFIGIGNFGSDFKPVLEPMDLVSISNDLGGNFLQPDDNTYYTRGISGALVEMHDKVPDTFKKRILIVVTDGYFSDEKFFVTKEKVDEVVLQEKTKQNTTFHIEFALLCDKHLAS